MSPRSNHFLLRTVLAVAPVVTLYPAFCVGAVAQWVSPDAPAALHDQANRNAQDQARDRAARQGAPDVRPAPFSVESLGALPAETPCFLLREIQVTGAGRIEFDWMQRVAEEFRGFCVGHAALNYILKALQGELINRGFITTRVGLPEQDLSSGTLRIQVLPGAISGTSAPDTRARREWWMAFPQGEGDILQLRAVEQGLEQMRRIPGRTVSVDIAPGPDPGQSVLDLKVQDAPPISGSLGGDNFAGRSVGNWQANINLTAVNLLGLNELMTVNVNGRIASPERPANTTGDFATFSLPFGWWTFAVTASASRYEQKVSGQYADFESLGTQKSIVASAEAVIHRDQNDHLSMALRLQRRWNRSFIDDAEIGLQHEDLTDLTLAIDNKYNLRDAVFDSELAYRQSVSWLGEQSEEAGRSPDLPTVHYKILTLDVVGTVPAGFSWLDSYHVEARGQLALNQPFGADLFGVGGPYSVRGYDPDDAELGRSGWYLRQELVAPTIGGIVAPFVFWDMGRAGRNGATLAGIGPGIRAHYAGFDLSGFVATALTVQGRKGCCRPGISLTYSF